MHSLMCFLHVFFFSAIDAHITQLSAVCSEEKFSTYILPRKPITPKASEITGIEVVNGKMFCKNEEINVVNISDGLNALLNFLSNFQTKVILVGHIIKSYDCHLLLMLWSPVIEPMLFLSTLRDLSSPRCCLKSMMVL